jgi:hypothetical protein
MNNSKEQQSIVGPGGAPFPRRITWRDKWNVAYSKSRTVLGGLVGLLAAIAIFVGNLESVQRYVTSHFFSPSIPAISLNLFNTGGESVGIIARGEFLVFFPGPGANHVVGTYELDPDNSDPILETKVITGVVIVPANKGTLLRLRIMNHDYFEKLLRQGDCDVTFMFRYQNGEHVSSDNVRNDTRPFTEKSLKALMLVDVTTKPNPAVQGTLRDKAAQRP